jgi:hypothetical protein
MGEEGSSAIEALPPEMLEGILDYFPYEDLKLIALVNHRFYGTAQKIVEKEARRVGKLLDKKISVGSGAFADFQTLSSQDKLHFLPPNLMNASSLQPLVILNLSNNYLTSLPSDFTNLKNLKFLYLGNNRISQLPENLGNLQNLCHLEVNNNPLKTLTPSLKDLLFLHTLFLHGTLLEALPPEVSQLPNLTSLTLDHRLMEKESQSPSPAFQTLMDRCQEETLHITLATNMQGKERLRLFKGS